jgi:hypothetical protein
MSYPVKINPEFYRTGDSIYDSVSGTKVQIDTIWLEDLGIKPKKAREKRYDMNWGGISWKICLPAQKVFKYSANQQFLFILSANP